MVVGAALGVLAASGPVGGAMATAIVVASEVNDLYADTNRRLRKGESLPTALGGAIVNAVASETVDHVAGQVAQTAVPLAIRATGLPVPPGVRKLITAAVAGAVSGG